MTPQSDQVQPAGPTQGPAFPVGVRLLASAMVVALLYWGVQSMGSLADIEWQTTSLILTGAAVLMVLWCLSWIWRSNTAVDTRGIEQSWIWRKHVRWADIVQARLIGVPGLEWLVAPRLVVRPRGGGLLIFYSADRKVLQTFASFISTGVPYIEP